MATTMECLLISPLNYMQNIHFFLFSFLKYRDFVFCHIDICRGQRTCTFTLFLGFVHHFLVYLSELFRIEFVRAAIFLMFLPFCLATLNLSIYLSAICLLIYLYKVLCASFPKAVLSAKKGPVIKTIYREIQIQIKALCKLYWVVQICIVIKYC